MSKDFLNKVCEQILSNLYDRETREQAEIIEGQLYIYDKDALLRDIEAILNQINLLKKTEKPLLDNNKIQAIKSTVENFHASRLKAGGSRITARRRRELDKLFLLVQEDYASRFFSKSLKFYYLNNYNTAVSIKSETASILQQEVEKAISTSSKKISEESIRLAGLLSGTTADNPNKLGQQIGHGEYGVAISNIKAYKALSSTDVDLRGLNKLQKKKILQWKNRIEKYLDEFDVLLTLKKEQIVTKKGKLRASFVPILSGQGLIFNAKDALKEASKIKELRDYFKQEAAEIEGSDNVLEAFRKVTLYNFTNLKKDPRVKVKTRTTPKEKIETKSSGKAKKKVKKKINISTTFSSGMDLSDIKVPVDKLIPKERKRTQSTLNLNALKAQINAKLYMTVIKNMGTPALENRTGRFARSVQVTDVTQTSKGFPSIGYTYQKYPYQTFEPGFKQGSTQRDPRTLIDRSIRDIAKDLIVGRFYTRRV